MAISVMIFGATRGTGFEAVRALVAHGVPVTAAVRETSDTSALEALGVACVAVDVFDSADVETVLRESGCNAIVLSLSGKRGETRRADREGVSAIVDAAVACGAERIVMVTAIGCGDSRPAVAPKVIEVLGEVLAAKTEAEEKLMGTFPRATIIRPGGLADDAASGTGELTEDHMAMGVINRSDLGQLVADAVLDAATAGRIHHAVDPGITWQAPLQRGEDITPKQGS